MVTFTYYHDESFIIMPYIKKIIFKLEKRHQMKKVITSKNYRHQIKGIQIDNS